MSLFSKPLRVGLHLASRFQGALKSYPVFAEAVRDRKGLEIGGPSKPFRENPLPIYNIVGSLDNCNYSRSTLWSENGEVFKFCAVRPAGRQWIADATDLSAIEERYDFILSSHNLEHIANPVKALMEWKKIAPVLILIVPDASRTFDRFRPTTPVEHMLEDYRRNVGEDDATHFDEVNTLHDIDWGWGFGADRSGLRESVRRNFEIRSIHHHVFSPANVQGLLEGVGARVKALETAYPHHICALAEW